MDVIWPIIKAALGAVFSALLGRLFGKPKDPETVEAENALAIKEQQAQVLARGVPDDATLDRIVREHDGQ